MLYTSDNYNQLSWNICGIYKITNIVNEKPYIGQSVNIRSRWREHIRTSQFKENLIYRAIRKYGLNNFTFEILEECEKEKLDEREKYWIKYYDSNNPQKGYNMNAGGGVGSDKNYKQYISKPVRAYLIDKEGNILDNGTVFCSCNEAARQLSKQFNVYYNGSTISSICNGKMFKEQYHTFCFIDANGQDVPTGYKNNYTTEIAVITPTNEILYFKSVAEASKQLDLERGNIFNALTYLDHKMVKGKYRDYRFYRKEDLPELSNLHREQLLTQMLNENTNYSRIYKLTKADGTIEYYTTIKEICQIYGINKSVIIRNYNKKIGRGKFKDWQVDTIDKEGAVLTRVRSKQ